MIEQKSDLEKNEALDTGPIIVFLNGLGGAGKSEIVRFLKASPITGWQIYDFDSDGEYKCPSHGTQEEKHRWRKLQMEWFLVQANQNALNNGKKTAIFGFVLFPSSTLDLEGAKLFKKNNIHFALIDCDHEERKKRLINRGTPGQWQGLKDWYPEFYHEMEKYGEMRFDNTSQPLEQTAKEIADWLESIK